MNWNDAFELLTKGYRLRRPTMMQEKSHIIAKGDDFIFINSYERENQYVLCVHDLVAEDWEVYS